MFPWRVGELICFWKAGVSSGQKGVSKNKYILPSEEGSIQASLWMRTQGVQPLEGHKQLFEHFADDGCVPFHLIHAFLDPPQHYLFQALWKPRPQAALQQHVPNSVDFVRYSVLCDFLLVGHLGLLKNSQHEHSLHDILHQSLMRMQQVTAGARAAIWRQPQLKQNPSSTKQQVSTGLANLQAQTTMQG